MILSITGIIPTNTLAGATITPIRGGGTITGSGMVTEKRRRWIPRDTSGTGEGNQTGQVLPLLLGPPRALASPAKAHRSRRNLPRSLLQRTRNAGGLKDADGFARIKGPCGDTMYIYLGMDGARIADVKFMTDWCGTTIACGSVVTDMTKGKEIKEASRIRHTHVLEALDGLPEADAHCAVLAASTLRAAIKDYLMAQRSKGKDGREP